MKTSRNIISNPSEMPKKERVTVVVAGRSLIKYMPLFEVWKQDMRLIFYAQMLQNLNIFSKIYIYLLLNHLQPIQQRLLKVEKKTSRLNQKIEIRFQPLNYIYIDMSYYTREYSPPGHYRDNNEHSPENKIYNVQQSQRKYEELIQQNLWLKQQIDRKRHGHVVDSNQIYHRQIQPGNNVVGDRSKNDMVLWSMIQRNRYLQQKLAKLKRQQQRQINSIRKIEQSQQWQSRHLCVPDKCYHSKYMQILRIRSPFF